MNDYESLYRNYLESLLLHLNVLLLIDFGYFLSAIVFELIWSHCVNIKSRLIA